MNKIIISIRVIAMLATIAVTNGCRKFIEVAPPVTSFSSGNVYTTDATAISAVTAMYLKMNSTLSTQGGGVLSTTLVAGLLADEFTLYSGVVDDFSTGLYTNSLSNLRAPYLWSIFYPIIYEANAALEGLNVSSTLTPAVKQQLIGEARFSRAFLYFYLVNLYGDVPLALSTDYKTNSLMPRTPAAKVWQQIIADLTDAQNLLSDKYPKSDLISYYAAGAEERVRPTKWAATALLARAYLYTGKWSDAETQATAVINNVAQYGMVSLSSAFLKNNKEAIWQFQPTSASVTNTFEGFAFILPVGGPNSGSQPVYLNRRLVNSFETGDGRRTMWIDSLKIGTDTFYYPYKYKITAMGASTAEYSVVLRLAEQYLIRAEARAQQANIGGAQADLNVIRTRAGLPNTAATDQPSLLTAILNERRHELFTEWGHRWLDLKRTNTIDAVMSIETPLKGGTWETYDALYPVPLTEMINNPKLTQTPGYN